MTTIQSPSTQNAALAADLLASLGVAARESFAIHPPDDAFEHGRVTTFDAALFAGNAPDQSLSDYALRWYDPASCDGIRRFIAPDVSSYTNGFVEYALYNDTERFPAPNDPDGLRPVGVDFPTLRHPSYEIVTQRIANRGIAVDVEADAEPPGWQRRRVAFLRGVLDRARLRRTVTLFVAGAVNVHKTWSTPPSDPDMDIIDELETQTLRASRVLYTPGAWARRAGNIPDGDASARKTLEELAGEFAVEEVRVVPERDAADQPAGGQVLLFCADDNLGRNDFSNLKTFTTLARTGQRYAVYLWQVSVGRWRVALECHETVAITSTVGLEVVTVG